MHNRSWNSFSHVYKCSVGRQREKRWSKQAKDIQREKRLRKQAKDIFHAQKRTCCSGIFYKFVLTLSHTAHTHNTPFPSLSHPFNTYNYPENDLEQTNSQRRLRIFTLSALNDLKELVGEKTFFFFRVCMFIWIFSQDTHRTTLFIPSYIATTSSLPWIS